MTAGTCAHVGVILLRLVGDRFRCLACDAVIHVAEVGEASDAGAARPAPTRPDGLDERGTP